MTTQHRKWQSHWHVDEAGGLATHDSGLRVKLMDGVGLALNAAEVEAALTPKHGTHNAPSMVARLTREGAQMLIDPYSRGWRGTAGKLPT